MLIDIKAPPTASKKLHQDLLGLVTVINDLFEREPHRFGNDPTEFKRRIDALNTDSAALGKEEFYTGFNSCCTQLGIDPFKDISLAVVGAHRATGKHEATLSAAQPILDRFKHKDISGVTTGWLTTESAPRFVEQGKFDYVLTCNVANAPDNHEKDDTVLACASITKEKGRIVHMIGYATLGEDMNRTVNDQRLQHAAGQQHRYHVPPGTYKRDKTDAIVVEQLQDVNFTPAHVAQLRRKLPATKVVEERSLEDMKAQLGLFH